MLYVIGLLTLRHDLVSKRTDLSNMEHFQLKNYDTYLASGISAIKNDPDLYDVSLTSAEKKRINGHKVILSALSPYLRKRIKELKNSQEPNEISLPGIKFDILQKIMQCLYYGKTSVEKSRSEDFNAACIEMEIRGVFNPEDDANTDEVNIKADPGADEDENMPGQVTLLPDGRAICIACGKNLSSLNSATVHYKMKHMPQETFKCKLCPKTYKSTIARGAHTRKVHGVSQKYLKNAVTVLPIKKAKEEQEEDLKIKSEC